MKNLAALKQFIKRASKEAGFIAAGICIADPLNEGARLENWLKNKNHGTMRWLEKDPAGRCDPKSLLPEAKSVICLAAGYGENGIQDCEKKNANGTHTARFARGCEYHEYVLGKLKALWDKISQESPASKAKFCVDTSPILEKALAVKAGLGWRGKNSLVIMPSKGSYFVLGEIITDMEIEPDQPVPDQCGDCSICISACPTGAIASPCIIDARRCLSYLTIEHKGAVEPELKKFISEGQYGCDICQEVCPYNRRRY
jgi:epoxyqueuosine reductase